MVPEKNVRDAGRLHDLRAPLPEAFPHPAAVNQIQDLTLVWVTRITFPASTGLGPRLLRATLTRLWRSSSGAPGRPASPMISQLSLCSGPVSVAPEPYKGRDAEDSRHRSGAPRVQKPDGG